MWVWACRYPSRCTHVLARVLRIVCNPGVLLLLTLLAFPHAALTTHFVRMILDPASPVSLLATLALMPCYSLLFMAVRAPSHERVKQD